MFSLSAMGGVGYFIAIGLTIGFFMMMFVAYRAVVVMVSAGRSYRANKRRFEKDQQQWLHLANGIDPHAVNN